MRVRGLTARRSSSATPLPSCSLRGGSRFRRSRPKENRRQRRENLSRFRKGETEAMVGTLERLGTDLAVEREILAETLTLYLGIVSHRTNQLLHRLTLVSVVFLPLTFLCGVYGMNFDFLPEVHWRYGYAYFWGAVLVIVVGTVLLMRAKRWW